MSLPPGIPEKVADGLLDFSTNQWTGYVDKDSFSKENKPVVFGPAPPGMMAYVEAAILLTFFKKLSETGAGLVLLKDIIIKYLDTTSDILTGLYKSSATHPITAIMNNHKAVSIYGRLGLMTAKQVTEERAWIDHVLGEFLKLSYVGDIMQGVQSLVESSAKVARADISGAAQITSASFKK